MKRWRKYCNRIDKYDCKYFNNVGYPTLDRDVATKAYDDSNCVNSKKIFSGYVPLLLSGYDVPNVKTGFIVSASSAYGDNYVPSYALNNYYASGNGHEGEWVTDIVWNDFCIQVE